MIRSCFEKSIELQIGTKRFSHNFRPLNPSKIKINSSACGESISLMFSSFFPSATLELSNLEVRVDSFINSDLRTHVGRRLADGGLSSSGDIGTDREDSPLQSKRSSTFEFVNISLIITGLISCSRLFHKVFNSLLIKLIHSSNSSSIELSL